LITSKRRAFDINQFPPFFISHQFCIPCSNAEVKQHIV
jgi:hypothetical protein